MTTHRPAALVVSLMFALPCSSFGPLSTPKKRWYPFQMAFGDYSVELTKPLGMVLEECEKGVKVKEVLDEGSAKSSMIAPGDVLLRVGDLDVSEWDFDSVMDAFASSLSPLRLTMGDGLGKMDMARNLMKTLEKDELFLVDEVVRAAVRRIRQSGRLGAVLQVEIIIGAGVSGEECRVRFFAIFSTDGVSSYSCNVSATGVKQVDGSIELTYLSCAKDEGLGQTIDLIP